MSSGGGANLTSQVSGDNSLFRYEPFGDVLKNDQLSSKTVDYLTLKNVLLAIPIKLEKILGVLKNHFFSKVDSNNFLQHQNKHKSKICTKLGMSENVEKVHLKDGYYNIFL